MTSWKPLAIALLALPLIAATDGGPPSIANFVFLVIAILVFFVVLRKLLPSGEDKPADRQLGRPIDPPLTPQKPIPLQTPDELMARLGRIREQAVAAPSLITEAPLSPPAAAMPAPIPPAVEFEPIPPQTDAILFHQHFPPRADALSYWGGIPLVPPGFVWPSFTTPEGVERALHPVIQIDCAAIPDAARLDLPDSGLLTIFVDLDWGNYWEWRVVHLPGDPRTFAPATVPATLPNAYSERAMWHWVRRDEDWPRLLPRWSFDPLLVRGETLPPAEDEDEAEERRFWPGTIKLAGELDRVDGAIVTSHYFTNRYGDDKRLVRPFANFPHDWQAVRIAVGELAVQAKRGHMERFAQRGDMTQQEVDAYKAGLEAAIDEWSARANGADAHAPLTATESDAAWQLFLDYQHVSLFALTEVVNQSIDATLSSNPDAKSILPEDAVALVRGRHALGSRGERGVHINTPDHLLGPPSYVQGGADERLRQWILLFEMSSNDPIGHLFAEGVYQFWIRPEDLDARRFDRVELDASAY